MLTLATAAAAQSPADAALRGQAEERRAQEREHAQREQLQRSPDARTPQAPASTRPWPASEAPCFAIREIVLAGQASPEFQWALHPLISGPDPAVGRCLGVDGVNVAAERVQQALVERGYVTSRVLLQSQDLSTGRLTLALVAGRIRAIRFAEGTDARATALNVVPARPGDMLNLRAIEQGLENLKRVPSAEADIQIAPADVPGESDLVIRWKLGIPIRLSATIDDSGTSSTGKRQGSATLSHDHWLTLNDLFYVTFQQDLGDAQAGTRGTRGHAVHYSLPWGYWLLGATAWGNQYHQSVAGINQDYVYSGTSQSAEIKLARLVARDARRKATLSLKVWRRRSSNAIDDTEVQAQRRATAGWELGLAHREFLGDATLDLSLLHRRGTGALGAAAAPEELFGEGTSRMRVSVADLNLNAPFTLAGQRLRYMGSARLQSNGTPLTPQDRFAIGGRYTVRGFDGESSLSAERGWLIRNDLALALANTGAQAYLGVDWGQVRGPSTGRLVGTHLAGAVLGVRGGFRHFSYDFFLGQPISRPQNFRTASTTAGFSVTASF